MSLTPRLRLLAVLGVALVASVGQAIPAQAYPQGRFACYGSVIRTDSAGEPVRANPFAAPCQADTQAAPVAQAKGPAGTVVTVLAAATTNSRLQDTPADGDNGTADANAQKVVVVSGTTVIKASIVKAQADVTCNGGVPELSGQATVGDLSINGRSIAVTGGEQTINTPAGLLHIDTGYRPVSYALYQRALWLEAPTGQMIIGEAAVAYIDSPCLDGPPPPPPPPPPPGFGCYANAIKYAQSRPYVANPSIGPCLASRAYAADFGLQSGLFSTLGLYASTVVDPAPLPAGPPYPDGASTTASAGAGAISVGSGPTSIMASGASAEATAVCRNGKIALSSSSQVHGLRVGTIVVGDTTEARNINVPDGVLHINWRDQNARTVDRRAVWLENARGADVIIGHVVVGENTNPC